VLVQGGVAPRSHRNRLWTLTARELASRGIASVRMDCRGCVDSTGAYLLDLVDHDVEEAAAILRVARASLGAVPIAVVGNCLGARTAFELAARMPDCVGIVCILETSLAPLTLLGRPPGADSARTRARTVIKRRFQSAMPGVSRRLAPLFRPAKKGFLSGGMPRLLAEVGEVTQRVPVLILECGTAESGAAIRRTLDRVMRAPARPGSLIVTVPTRGTAGIRPLVTQDGIRSNVVAWMDKRFAASRRAVPDETLEPGSSTGMDGSANGGGAR
jgi:pimeloyl-ACP methyl ester carboxylesterase